VEALSAAPAVSEIADGCVGVCGVDEASPASFEQALVAAHSDVANKRTATRFTRQWSHAMREAERMPNRPSIILDCDPGHDDVIAIVVAANATDLLGITTVAGNAPLDRTTYNACVMREMLGLSVGVHSGAARPLVAEPLSATYVHGESGLDGADLPVPERGPDSADAIGFIIETCRSTEGARLVATGPLTNVALALRAAPDLAGRVAGISLMGGGTFGNRTAMAEFNLWADPEAAAIVFGCGVPLSMAGLDVTHQFIVDTPRIAQVAALGGRLATVLADLFRFFASRYVARHDDMAGAALHDPLAVLALTHPDLFTGTDRHVSIETSGIHTRGMTAIDRRALVERPAPNCHVLEHVDSDAAWNIVIESIVAAGDRSEVGHGG
jgi:inosine-uridine nucleoside N-ribohydrolase